MAVRENPENSGLPFFSYDEKEYTEIFDHLPFALCIIQSDRNIIYANKALSDLTQTPAESLMGGEVCAAFGCENAMQESGTHILNSACADCSLRKAIDDTFATGSAHANIENEFTTVTTTKARAVFVSANTVLVRNKGHEHCILSLQDLSRRKHMENELRRSNRKLEAISDNLWQRLKERECLNAVFEEFEKDNPVDMLLANCARIIPFGFQHQDITCARIVLDGNEYSTDNFSETSWKLSFPLTVSQNKLGDLTVCYLEERPAADIGPFFNEEAELVKTIALRLQNVVENRLLQEQLRLQSAAMDNAMVYIIICDARIDDMPIVYVNKSFKQMTGYSPHEVLGKNPRFLQANDRDQPGLEQIRRALQNKSRCTACVQNYRKDGSMYLCEIRISPIYDEHDEVSHFVGVSSDVTEFKELQKRLVDNEQRLKLAIEGAGDGVWDWNIQTGEMFFSRLYMTMLGYEEDELPNHEDTWRNSIHPDDMDRIMDSLNAHLEGKIPDYAAELRIRCKDGGYTWIMCRGSVVARDAGGKPTRMIGINTDISERKKSEEELIRSWEAADRANQAKSEFLSSMSHELRTPLNSILGFGQILEMEEGLTREQLDYVGEIKTAGDHLLALINEVLDLSRIESGNIDLLIEPVSCSEAIEESLQLVHTLAAKKGISISYSVNAALSVRADKTRIKQVLVNLLTNGVKYNPPEGRIEITAVKQETTVRISVTDTGYGIAEDKLKDLFTPFNRLGRETGDIPGTGIGLTFSKRLIDLMGGTIGVESTPDEGSTFWVELPI